MRWIVLCLVLINALIWGWNHMRQQPAKMEPEAPFVPSGASLMTLEELAESPSSDVAVAAIERATSSLESMAPVVHSVSSGVSASANSAREPLSSALARSVSPSSAMTAESEAAVAASSQAGAVDEQDCYVLGPFTVESEREALIKRFKELRVMLLEQSIETSAGERFWLYLPPRASREEAKNDLAVLQQQGIESFLMNDGEHRHAISLGLFSKESSANTALAALQKKGINPLVHRYERRVTERWLWVHKGQLDAVGDGLIAKMTKNITGLAASEKKCRLPVVSAR